MSAYAYVSVGFGWFPRGFPVRKRRAPPVGKTEFNVQCQGWQSGSLYLPLLVSAELQKRMQPARTSLRNDSRVYECMANIPSIVL